MTYEAELAVMASRPPEFYREIANRVLEMDEVISEYAKLVEKGKIYGEFVKGTWPELFRGRENLGGDRTKNQIARFHYCELGIRENS